MRTLKLSKYFLVLIAALCMAFGFLTLTSVPTAKAEAPTGFVMNGASVRFKQDGESDETSTAGIRFETQISQTEYAALGTVTEVGFLVVPSAEYAGTIDLTTAAVVENKILKIIAVGGENNSKFSVGDNYAFRGYIYKIPKASYYDNLRAVSYITAGENTYYTEVCTRSIGEVAAKAYSDLKTNGDADYVNKIEDNKYSRYTADQRIDLKKYINSSIIQSFNNDLSLSSLYMNNTPYSIEVADNLVINGENKVGVAEITVNSNGRFRFDLPLTVNEYITEGYDYFGITFATDYEYNCFKFDGKDDFYTLDQNVSVRATNKWKTYLVSIEDLVATQFFDANGHSKDNRYFEVRDGNNKHLYIAEICAYKASELIKLTSPTTSTGEMVQIEKADGVSEIYARSVRHNRNYSYVLANNTFLAAYDRYIVSFEKGGEDYSLFKFFRKTNANDIDFISIVEPTDNLIVGQEISLTLNGVSYFGSADKFAVNDKVWLYSVDGNTETQINNVVSRPNDNDFLIKFTANAAGKYRIKIKGDAYAAFDGEKNLDFYVKDKVLTVSGNANVSGTTMTLPAPVLTSLTSSATYDYVIDNVSVVIAEQTFTSTASLEVTVTKLGNYIATYTVTGEDGIKYNCTLSGLATDGNVLSVDAPSTVEIDGDVPTLTLPEPALKDSSNNNLVYSNCNIVLTKGNANIELTGRTFPAVVGEYKAVYNVDYSGITYACSYEFNVIAPINTFATEVSNIELRKESLTDGSTITWLSEKTVGGVTKYGIADLNLVASGDNKYFMFDLNSSLANVQQYDYIGLDVYSSHSIREIEIPYESEKRVDTNENRVNFTDRWVTLLFPVSFVKCAFNEDGTAKPKTDGKNYWFRILRGDTGTAYHLYIADISLYRAEDLISLSPATTGSNVTLTLADGVSNLEVRESQATHRNVTTTAGFYNDNTFFVNQSKYIINFTKNQTNYSILKIFDSIAANDVTTITWTTTSNFKVGSEITLNLVGARRQGYSSALAVSDVYLKSVDGSGNETDINNAVTWADDWATIKFTPSAAGTYRIKISSSYDSFIGTKVLEFTVTE